MVLKITNLHILRYLPTCWLYLLERYAIDNQRCTHAASDIAVTVIESEEGKIEGKLGVSFIGVGGKSQEGKSTSNESRVKFSIPVCLPVTNIIGK